MSLSLHTASKKTKTTEYKKGDVMGRTEQQGNLWEKVQYPTRHTCMLMITHACNLNCTYCYEKFKSDKMMSFEQATDIILKECDVVLNDDRFTELEIDLMGGEPMMNYPLIKQLVEWADENPLPVPFIFFMTTNGTLFDEERKEWFRKYKHIVTCGASYDGTPEMQRKNRATAKDSIDMAFFHETWPMQAFHMTISQETLPSLAEGILEIQRKGFRLEAALAQGVDWTDEDAKIYYRQLTLLEEAYLQDNRLKPINLLTNQLHLLPSEKIVHQKQEKWCGSGTYMTTYDINGKAYGCHLFTPIVLGDRAMERHSIDWNCSDSTEDPDCKECVLKMVCPTCAGFNFCYRGDVAKRDHRWCKMIFMEKLVACEFQIKIMAQRMLDLTEDDARHAQGALEAYKLLSKFDCDNLVSPFVKTAKKGGVQA